MRARRVCKFAVRLAESRSICLELHYMSTSDSIRSLFDIYSTKPARICAQKPETYSARLRAIFYMFFFIYSRKDLILIEDMSVFRHKNPGVLLFLCRQKDAEALMSKSGIDDINILKG